MRHDKCESPNTIDLDFVRFEIQYRMKIHNYNGVLCLR